MEAWQAEGEEEAKPKGKNPLDLLPPSKMVLDSWKRLYSNTPASQFRNIAIKGLWEGADIPNSPTNEVRVVPVQMDLTFSCLPACLPASLPTSASWNRQIEKSEGRKGQHDRDCV
jgi:Elongation factor 1 gamma, conserved domain